MLELLHIENVAIIEKTDIEFARGMNVLTGETGAGKSIIVDALGAVLGGRTSRELVRSGAEAALVTAVFDTDGTLEWCEENGIDCPDGELVLSRRITADGRNACRINGTPVAVAQLRELGDRLLNIHGQNDGQRLLDERFHRDYLDGFGGLESQLAEYRVRYEAYQKTKREIQALSQDEGEKERRAEALRHQIDELERAQINPGEMEERTRRRELLKNAARLTSSVDAAYFALHGGEDAGAVALIDAALGAVSGVSRYSEALPAVEERLTELKYTAEDLLEEISDFRRSLEFSPGELEEVEGRLDTLRRLTRKYGGDEPAMLDFLDKARLELEEMEFSGERRQKLEIGLAGQEKELAEAGRRLSEARRAAALELETRIRAELHQLSMAGVAFEVCFEAEQAYESMGMDRISFLMSANAGEKPGKISRIASGGELARIMLAMKSVLAETDEIPSLVFDEVDSGVSGIAAQRVGEKLAALAQAKQVICITHLPQIAAMADAHFSIAKETHSGRTFTEVTRLDAEGRTHELARLHGGNHITELTLQSAAEQLAAAAAYKNKAQERDG